LAWISSTRASACSAVGHDAPVFTSDLLAFQHPGCGLAASRGHVDGFPALGLLRRLRPTRRPSADDEPARPQPGRLGGRAAAGRFPRSPRDRSTGSASSYSPAASPRVRRSPSSWPPRRPND